MATNIDQEGPRYCNHCGKLAPAGVRFCGYCGQELIRAVEVAPKPNQKAESARSRSSAGDVGWVAGRAFVLFMRAGPKAWVSAAVLVLFVAIYVTWQGRSADSAKPGQSSPGAQAVNAPTPVAITRPTVPPPQFRLYRLKFDDGIGQSIIAFVVPTKTTDEELKSLVWFFRDKVRSQNFRDIGVTQPTSKHWGKRDYVQGMLQIYRGAKCAGEEFTNAAGPCGGGEHDDAYYQWGESGDDPKNGLDPNKDEAGIRLSNGNMVTVFDYKDGWQPTKTEADRQREIEESAKARVLDNSREQYANQLQATLRQEG